MLFPGFSCVRRWKFQVPWVNRNCCLQGNNGLRFCHLQWQFFCFFFTLKSYRFATTLARTVGCGFITTANFDAGLPVIKLRSWNHPKLKLQEVWDSSCRAPALFDFWDNHLQRCSCDVLLSIALWQFVSWTWAWGPKTPHWLVTDMFTCEVYCTFYASIRLPFFEN